MTALDPVAIATMFAKYGPTVSIIALLGGGMWQLIKYITEKTVPLHVYDQEHEYFLRLESASSKQAAALNEVVAGQQLTNKLVEMLLNQRGVES